MTLRVLIAGLLLLTAVSLGLVAYQIARPPASELSAGAPGPAKPVLQSILVTARAIPAGSLVRDEDFATRPLPPEQVPPDAIPDNAETRARLRGGLVRRFLESGSVVTSADVLQPKDRGFLAAVLTQGTRAISVGVDPVTGVAGLIWPGDRVDVILTQQIDPSLAPLSHRFSSETVMTDVRVIAIDQQIAQGAEASAGSAPSSAAPSRSVRTVTLEVTLDQAQRIAVAERLGQLSLVVRPIETGANGGPPAPATTFGADVSPALSRTAPPEAPRMQVIQGDRRDEVKFP